MLPQSSLFIGEISLTGQIKSVMFLEKRVKEALKLGSTDIYIPSGTKEKLQSGLKENEYSSLKELLHVRDIIQIL